MPSIFLNTYFLQVFLVIGPAFILYGYNQAGLSALLNLPDCVHHFPQVDTLNTSGATKSENSTIQGVVNGCFQLGALFGSLSCSIVGDQLGRRKTILAGALLAGIGQILQCTSFNLAQFVVGRAILGFGVGQLSVTIPVWQSEISAAGKRGRRVITAGIFICVGFTMSSWINFGFTKVQSEALQWRVPLALPFIFSVIICLSIFSLPESPRWLVQSGQIAKATETLASLNGLTVNNSYVRSEIETIQHALETASQGSLKDVFDPNDQSRLRYRFTLCLVIQALQQLVGGNLISIYTTKIFRDNLHLDGDLPQILAASSLTWKFLCSFIAFAVVDRFGRRLIFVVSGTGMSICMVVMAIATSFPGSNKAASIVAATFVFIFNLCYPIGFLGGNFLYCTEIAPVRLRVAMSSISTANHWLWNFIIAMITPVALENIGWRYYIVFAVMSACVPLIVLPFFPETMNRNLELIDGVFREARSIWDIVPLARKLPQGDVSPETGPLEKKGMMDSTEHKEFA
ncbi:unnamed protein product [Penicillium olsonii]|uniref:Major facilitator superfamily (MFS) profile domain-containing protein n=1 Tax=Penicillium olsonii TaxID=99116 RepID=A0A9W4ID75_PENOL|nr:unnamed protein product [Penicillium olsonii]CAG8262072.1 unnamed protein product [Penicillium olsonii]